MQFSTFKLLFSGYKDQEHTGRVGAAAYMRPNLAESQPIHTYIYNHNRFNINNKL